MQQLTVNDLILQKLIRNNSNLSTVKRNFHVVGLDNLNPWNMSVQCLTPKDVFSLTEAGVPIIATPHIGRHWRSNSMYPSMGVKIVDFTGNQSVKDTDDQPDWVFEGGVGHLCSIQKDAILSPYLQLDRNTISSNGYVSAKIFANCNNLSHVHHIAKKQALGEQNVMLDIDLLDEPWVLDYFQILILNEAYILKGFTGNKQEILHQGLFDRWVDSSGVVRKCSPGGFEAAESFLDLKRQHREMILEDKVLDGVEGNIPINAVANTLLDALWCYWHQLQKGVVPEIEELGTTYTTAGIWMINYTRPDSFRDLLDRMYKTLLNSGKFNWLPQQMRYVIVPGGVFKFLPLESEGNLVGSVNELLDAVEEKKLINKKFAETKLPDLKASEVLRNRFNLARQNFKSTFFEAKQFSQYDLLRGEKMDEGIMNRLMNLTFEETRLLFKTD